MTDNVSPLPDKLTRLARTIKKALDRRTGGRVEWIEGTIEAAVDLAAARHEFADDNNRFGLWCRDNGFGEDTLNKNDRAALIAMGADPKRLRETLEATKRWSIQLIYQEAGFPSARNTPLANKRPVENRAREIVRPLVETGKPPTSKDARVLEKEHGISHVMFEQAAAAERARVEAETKVFNELRVDPTTLSVTAAQKLEVAKRMMERRLNTEHAARTKQIDEEVRQRVLTEGKAYRDRMESMWSEHLEWKERFRQMIDNHQAIFTVAEFMTILKCLHPDNSASPETRADAFRLFNSKKLQLTKER